MQQPGKLLNRNFVLLWIGQSVSQFGSQGFSIAMLFWTKHATGSASLMGLMLMTSALPAVLLGPIGGVFADRHSRRRIIILSDVLAGIGTLSIAGLMFAAPDATGLILVGLMVVATGLSAIGAFFGPAIYAAGPDLVPKDRVATANSLGQVSSELAMFFGQGLGGTLFRLLGAPALLLANGVTRLFSAASESFIAIPQVIPPRHSSSTRESIRAFAQDTADGLRYVWNRGGLRELVFASAGLSFFTMPVISLLPFFVEDSLGVSVDWYGFIVAAFGAGSLAGYLLAGTVKLAAPARSRWLATFMILEAAGYGLLGLARAPMAALILALAGGVADGFVTVYIATVVQLSTPTAMRGRVYGVLTTLAASVSPLATGLSGIVADLTGRRIPLIYLACGAIMTVMSVIIALNPGFRGLLASDMSAAAEPKLSDRLESV